MIRYPGQSPSLAGAVEDGGLLLTSGIVAPEVLAGTAMAFDEEARSALRQMGAVLRAAGRTLTDVMRLEVFLADQADFSPWNDVFVQHWPDPEQRPARTTVVVGFALSTIRFEVQAVVATPGGRHEPAGS